MQRPDWKIAGAAGLAIGVTIGGFSLVSAGGLDRAVRNIEIQGERVQATDGGLMLVDDITASPDGSAAPSPSDSLSASAGDSVASPDATDSVSASLDSPHATAAARTAAPAASAGLDSTATVASIDSVDSADSSD